MKESRSSRPLTVVNTGFNTLKDSPDWNAVDAIEVIGSPSLVGEDTLLMMTSAGELNLTVNNSALRLRSVKQREYDYGLLVGQQPALKLELTQTEKHTTICSESMLIHINHRPLSLQVCDLDGQIIIQSATDGHFVRRHRVPPLAKLEHGWLMSFALKSGEAVFGLGEKWGALNKRGQFIRSYNHDALGVNAEISYKNVPFCWSHEGWGVFSHTPAPVSHAVGFASWSQRSYCSVVEDDVLDLFVFISKPSGAQSAEGKAMNAGANILRDFTELTGRAPIPPVWTTGVILSKAYYRTEQEILDVAHQVRERGMPCDVITFDGRAWQDTQTRFAFEWSSSRYPNPELIVNQLKALNFKICIWEYPLISINHAWFEEFASKGWLLTDRRTGEAYQYQWDQQAFGDVLSPLPISGIVDFTHPDAYAFWRDAHRPLFDLGIDMIKADFGEQIEDDNMLAHNGESGHALHNVYAHLYNRCVYEAAELYSKSGPFLFSRACWTGSQRFNSHWGGDPQADWEGMISNIRGGLSWGLSGAPFYATDVGGFYKDTRDDTLYVRWAQAAVFSAHFRLHGIGPREPWSYSPAADAAVSKALRLRYQLQAYLKTTMCQSHNTGLPVQRAMSLAFPEEKQSWGFENQFMFGDDLLVVPCFDPSGEVEFYLPQGRWYPFEPDCDHSLDVLLGQRVHRQSLALDKMAVFAKLGTKIPLCKPVQFTEQHGERLQIESNWLATSTN
ncbi:MAG: alpha-D-xyloside xylohydrolase [Arenicella sp.]|jgi:alpha-D-xyloside xylohydrolase